MVTYTTITISHKGEQKPFYSTGTNRRLSEDEIHEIVVRDSSTWLYDLDDIEVNVFFNTKES